MYGDHDTSGGDQPKFGEADDAPTADEEAAAERAGDVDPDVAEAMEEAAERGKDVKGEGEIGA